MEKNNQAQSAQTKQAQSQSQTQSQATGAIRTIDELNRIVLPKTVCEQLGIFKGDSFEVITQGVDILLKRYAPACLACDDDTDVQKIHRTFLCGECRDAVNSTLPEVKVQTIKMPKEEMPKGDSTEETT